MGSLIKQWLIFDYIKEKYYELYCIPILATTLTHYSTVLTTRKMRNECDFRNLRQIEKKPLLKIY